MNALHRILIVCLVAGGLAVAAGAAQAESPAVVDCNAHQKLTHHYSPAQLQNALATMPADVKEYSDCYQVIQNQLFAQIGKTGARPSKASSSSGGSSGTLILIIVVVLIVLAGGGLAYVASRRRGSGLPGGGGMPPPAAGG